ncbi:MAG TPA: hypothetical protein VGD27_15065 [Longimicrobiales bacterium]
MRVTDILRLLMVAACTACSSAPRWFDVIAPPPERAAFAGDWTGWYEVQGSRSGGSISLKFYADSTRASGEVVPVREAAHGYFERGRTSRGPTGDTVHAHVFTIRFIRLRGAELHGELESERDPLCACMRRLSFNGTRSGDRILGTFRSTHAEGDRGTFELTRTK